MNPSSEHCRKLASVLSEQALPPQRLRLDCSVSDEYDFLVALSTMLEMGWIKREFPANASAMTYVLTEDGREKLL